jgi:hypothetical protein
MADMRCVASIALAALLAACSGPTPQQRAQTAELHDLETLKRQYPGVISGFDLRSQDTLIVSIDLQRYIEMDDDAVIALKRDALEGWRTAWIAQHAGEHATLHLRLIDFIGRKVADEATKV